MTLPTRSATISHIRGPRPIRGVPASEAERPGYTDLPGMIGSLRRESPLRDTAREVLATRHRPLARSCARRFQNSPEADEDPRQAGYPGLIKATPTGTSATSAGRFRSTGPSRNRGSLRATPPPSSARRNIKQAEIGQHTGISQLHLSRLLAGTLGYRREC